MFFGCIFQDKDSPQEGQNEDNQSRNSSLRSELSTCDKCTIGSCKVHQGRLAVESTDMETINVTHDEVPSEVEATRSPDISALQGVNGCEKTKNE